MKKCFFVLVILVFLSPAFLHAQDLKIGFGVTWTESTSKELVYDYYQDYGYYYYYSYYTYEENFEMRLSMPIWLTNTVVFEPTLDFDRFQSGDFNTTSAKIGFIGRVHPFSNKIPYLGFSFSVDGVGLGAKSQNVTLGPLIGGEYFITESFSMGTELRLDLYQDPFDAPKQRALIFSTYAGIGSRFYF